MMQAVPLTGCSPFPTYMEEPSGDVTRIGSTVPDGGSVDDILSALADRQRHHLLAVLQEVATPEAVPALTRSLAVEADRAGDDQIEDLRVRLYHVHVPKLEDAGLVTYHDDQNTVDLTDAGETVAAELDL